MFRKLTILCTLMSFCPVAAGAQDLALLVNSQPALEQRTGETAGEVNLTPPLEKRATLMAANDLQGQDPPTTEAARPQRTHTGLTFKEFAEVHWGGYRWVYWVGAVAAIAALHVFAFGKD